MFPAMATPTGIEIVRQFMGSSPFPALVGLHLEEIEEDRAVMTLAYRPELVTIGNTVHGGAIATLADSAASAAGWATPAPPENLRGTTVSLNVSFAAAANAIDLRAEATVVKRGRSLSFIDVAITGPGGEMVAKAAAVYKLG